MKYKAFISVKLCENTKSCISSPPKLNRVTMAAAAKSVTVSIDKLSPSTPSLCIPRVFPNITWERVKDALEDVGLGEIDRVDMVLKKNEKGESFKRVFVHFKRWATTPEATQAREMVLSGEMFQVTYDDPWFWKVGMSHADKPERRTGGDKKKFDSRKKTRPVLKTTRSTPQTKHTTVRHNKTVNEASELRTMLEEQRCELEMLREQMAQMISTKTPLMTPQEYRPPTGPTTPIGTPPPLTRHCANQAKLEECGTYDHIARELETEFDEAA